MRRLAIAIVYCAAFQLLLPSPAQAWWGWLDELSGPGPWMFIDGQYRIVCVPDPKAAGLSESQKKNPPADVLRSLDSFDGLRRVAAAIGGSGCLLQPPVSPRASINYATGPFVSIGNNLHPLGSKRYLVMYKHELSASTFLDRWKIFEASAGGGWLIGLRTSDFTRGYWTVTGTISPYAALARDSGGKQSWLRTISVKVGVVGVPQGFSAKDFGASGTFRTDGELLKTISITLDFSRF